MADRKCEECGKVFLGTNERMCSSECVDRNFRKAEIDVEEREFWVD